MDPEPEDEPLSEVNPEPEDEPLSEVDPEPEDENKNRDHVLSCIEEDTILCEFVGADDTIAIGLTVCLSTRGRGDKTTCVNATSPPPNDKAYCGCCEEENDEVTGECPDEEEDEPQSDLIIVA